jgi:hypothetical protein
LLNPKRGSPEDGAAAAILPGWRAQISIISAPLQYARCAVLEAYI